MLKLKRFIFSLQFICLLLASASIIYSGCSNVSPETGILHGIVSIGPISPVERPGEVYDIPCEVYEARKIMIYTEEASRLIQQVDIDCDGRYKTDLKPGIYTVDINRIGIDSSSDVPQKVEIKSGLTTRLDIDIDTGIR
ncbi:hypothetical protein ACFLU2_01850 [Chloroflexota bacterium]